MLPLALAAFVALAPCSRAAVPDADADLSPLAAEEDDTGRDRKDPCRGREGWVGDGEDGRDPPACDGPDAEPDPEAQGLRAPDWLRDDDGDEDGGYER